jgi:hypothetical protein
MLLLKKKENENSRIQKKNQKKEGGAVKGKLKFWS